MGMRPQEYKELCDFSRLQLFPIMISSMFVFVRAFLPGAMRL